MRQSNGNTYKPSRSEIRKNALKREFYWSFSRWSDSVQVAEFPKSGGTWLGQLLSEVTGKYFPRNNMPPKFRNVILHGHKLSSPLYSNVCVMHRDGRDIMVSAYYHFLFDNEWNNSVLVEKTRNQLGFVDCRDIAHNLPTFIEWMHYGYSKGPLRFSWPDFVSSWSGKGVPVVFYEALLDNGAAEVFRLCGELGVRVTQERCEEAFEKYRIKKREPNAEGGEFVRKGISGDWKNHFNRAAAEIFDELNGAALISLGYESNSNWVARL